nr:MAG TPA: hypothetical protein [Caudoviricetes sp.]DAP60942.1 MAG TPA: hypothetical protein [Caudoviricetes sp.]
MITLVALLTPSIPGRRVTKILTPVFAWSMKRS